MTRIIMASEKALVRKVLTASEKTGEGAKKTKRPATRQALSYVRVEANEDRRRRGEWTAADAVGIANSPRTALQVVGGSKASPPALYYSVAEEQPTSKDNMTFDSQLCYVNEAGDRISSQTLR
ncbi:unnamed protein product [Soboliphyme baturini]|uniref:Uncharacterized protein n=1 Tax=Soboliphyme baturini TaxID=241478 RepID=A0A183J798_9BILA|nr:unnamed protein product [Soboliphyme baturini]